MNEDKKLSIIPDERVISKIFLIRDEKVMLDSDLAELYGVETRRMNEQVKRNKERFPKDFMFQLTVSEFENLKSQIATSSWGGRRKLPYAFTEHGVFSYTNSNSNQYKINTSDPFSTIVFPNESLASTATL